MAIDLSALSTRQALTAIYIGYYDRAADPAGIQFWEQVVANTSLDLVAITTDFAGQSETQAVHPFFADPATSSPATFITSLYQNLFNRDPDDAGLTFWSDALQDAIDGVAGAITVGQIITSIIEGAVDVEGGTQDRTTILNKIEVGLDWTEAAEAAEIDYTSNSAAQASAKAIIEGVTEDEATVAAAKASTDDFFDAGNGGGGGTPGDSYLMTSGSDILTGTDNDDTFFGYIVQNSAAGGVSNSVSSGDRLDGGAGNDRLYAEVTKEFVGNDGDTRNDIDLALKAVGIEEIDIEARDDSESGANPLDTVIVDAGASTGGNEIRGLKGHDEIGSYYSDGDLIIENLTTLDESDNARNTSEITVTMDHTDNFNSDGDAADLAVYFDNDYLLSGQESEGEIRYFLLDEDAELAGLDDRLDNIDVDGLRFNITNSDGSVTAVVLEAPEANTAGTHQGFVNALQAPLQALIDDGTLPAGTTLTLNPLLTDFTFLDDGSRSDDIPAIVLTSGDGSRVEATGFSRIEEEIGEYDVYGRFESRNETADQPISVDIDLHKVGRGGDGGDLTVGGKTGSTQPGIAAGIEVFNIDVLGAGAEDSTGALAKPSSLGTVTSTGNALRVVNIATAAEFATGASYASLEIRDGFNQFLSGIESGDLQLVNADSFLGDLALGTSDAIVNLDTLTAQGGGDVTFNGLLNGAETAQAYSYTTGAGADSVTVTANGDALDYAGSSLNVSTGDGADSIDLNFANLGPVDPDNNVLNQAVLDNVMVEGGAGDDMIDVDGFGNAMIMGGSGDDAIFTDGNGVNVNIPSTTLGQGPNAIWALNVDDARATAQGLAANGPEDLPGVQPSLAFLSGASVTVTLSGAGVASYADGGGLMSQFAASRFDDGYENIVTIGALNNGNEHFGDQTDINDAIMTAINDDPVLGKLLTASIGADNTLVIVSNTSGNFAPEDLRIEILQDRYSDAANAASVLEEAQALFADSSLVNADLFAGTTATSAYIGGAGGYGADISTTALADAWYDGLSVVGDAANGITTGLVNLHTQGAASISETDNDINGGSGDDLIVLSTDGVGGGVTAFQTGPNNAMLNGASNETIILTGSNFGDDTVMNFTDDATEAGVDFIDLTAYLTSQFDFSGAGGSADSYRPIPVTVATDTTTIAANEVAVITFDPANNAEWEGLGASQIAALLNNTGTTANDYGTLDDSSFSVAVDTTAAAVVNGASKAVIMVENADNDGEYRLFELTWNSSDTPASLAHTVAVNELGELDFGDSLDAFGEANLVGSAAYDALLAAFPT